MNRSATTNRILKKNFSTTKGAEMKKQFGFTLPEVMILVWVAVVLGAVVGWVMNIVTIVHTCCEPLTGMLVVRIVGIFVAPLGAVLGYF